MHGTKTCSGCPDNCQIVFKFIKMLFHAAVIMVTAHFAHSVWLNPIFIPFNYDNSCTLTSMCLGEVLIIMNTLRHVTLEIRSESSAQHVEQNFANSTPINTKHLPYTFHFFDTVACRLHLIWVPDLTDFCDDMKKHIVQSYSNKLERCAELVSTPVTAGCWRVKHVIG